MMLAVSRPCAARAGTRTRATSFDGALLIQERQRYSKKNLARADRNNPKTRDEAMQDLQTRWLRHTLENKGPQEYRKYNCPSTEQN
jgi:hypothetical protein